MFSSWPLQAVRFLNSCMKMNPRRRLTAQELLNHTYFIHDTFLQTFLEDLKNKIEPEFNNPLLKATGSLSADKKEITKHTKVLYNTRRSFVLNGRSIKRKSNSISLENSKKKQPLNSFKRTNRSILKKPCLLHVEEEPLEYKSSESSIQGNMFGISPKHNSKSKENIIRCEEKYISLDNSTTINPLDPSNETVIYISNRSSMTCNISS